MTPDYKVVSNRKDITALIRDHAARIFVTDEAGFKSDTVEIELTPHDSSVPIPPDGAELEVWLGYREAGLQKMGTFVVEEVTLTEPPLRITVRGQASALEKSIDHRALQASRNRSWHNQKLGEIVERIAKEHGYTPVIAPELYGKQIDHIDQTNESDLHLITRLAERFGATAKPVERRLVFGVRGASATLTGKPAPRVAVHRSQCSKWSATFKKRKAFNKVLARWHDAAAAVEKLEEAKIDPADKEYRLPNAYPTKGEASAAAAAKLREFQRGSASFNFTLPGDPVIAAEAFVDASGFYAGVDGEWVIDKATHDCSDSGYSVSVDAAVPPS